MKKREILARVNSANNWEKVQTLSGYILTIKRNLKSMQKPCQRLPRSHYQTL